MDFIAKFRSQTYCSKGFIVYVIVLDVSKTKLNLKLLKIIINAVHNVFMWLIFINRLV